MLLKEVHKINRKGKIPIINLVVLALMVMVVSSIFGLNPVVLILSTMVDNVVEEEIMEAEMVVEERNLSANCVASLGLWWHDVITGLISPSKVQDLYRILKALKVFLKGLEFLGYL